MTEVVTASSEIDVVCCPFETLIAKQNQNGVAVIDSSKFWWPLSKAMIGISDLWHLAIWTALPFQRFSKQSILTVE